MYKPNLLHTVPVISLLALSVSANASTVNLFSTEDGQQALPQNASPIALGNNPFAELSTMTISELIGMKIHGQPLTVQLHLGNGKGDDAGGGVVIYSAQFPDGVFRGKRGDDPVTATPLPAAAWLMMSGLLGMVAVGRRRQHNA